MMIKLSVVYGLLIVFIAYFRSIVSFFSNNHNNIDLSVYPYYFYESELYVFFAIILFFILIPFSEELLFRGLIQTKLMDNIKGEYKIFLWNFKLGTIIALIFFIAYHLVNLLPPFSFSLSMMVSHLIFVAIIGIFFSYIYQETRSITGSFIMHSIINGLPFAIGYIFYILN